jgi:hypothetical protein
MPDSTCIGGRTINRQPRALPHLLCGSSVELQLACCAFGLLLRVLVSLSHSSERACTAALSVWDRPATKKQTLTNARNARGSAGYDGNG